MSFFNPAHVTRSVQGVVQALIERTPGTRISPRCALAPSQVRRLAASVTVQLSVNTVHKSSRASNSYNTSGTGTIVGKVCLYDEAVALILINRHIIADADPFMPGDVLREDETEGTLIRPFAVLESSITDDLALIAAMLPTETYLDITHELPEPLDGTVLAGCGYPGDDTILALEPTHISARLLQSRQLESEHIPFAAPTSAFPKCTVSLESNVMIASSEELHEGLAGTAYFDAIGHFVGISLGGSVKIRGDQDCIAIIKASSIRRFALQCGLAKGLVGNLGPVLKKVWPRLKDADISEHMDSGAYWQLGHQFA